MSLFRREALEAQRSKYYGQILLNGSLSGGVLTAIAVVITAILLGFLVFGTYTQKQRVTGRLVPDKGLVHAFAQQSGTIVSVHVAEGDAVQQGQLLYVIRTLQIVGSGENAAASIRRGLLDQRDSLGEESARQEEINRERILGARRRLESARAELAEVDKSLSVLESQLTLVRETLSRYEDLAEKGLFPRIRVEEKRVETLQLESSRRALERERVVVEKQIRLASEEISTETLAGENQISLIQRNRKTAERALLEHEARSELRVVAPIAGVVSAIFGKPGQTTANRPLLSIVPENSTLQAELYAPTHAVSFVRSGSAVHLRYLAFPYQKFGQHSAVVETVSKTTMPLAWLEVTAPETAASSPQVYRVLARLEKQTLEAYGRTQRLQPGMEFEADVLLDHRRLYEWLLEPIFSVSGKI